MVFLIIIGILSPNMVKAQLGTLPFGGFVTLSLPCTCSPGVRLIWFAPFWFGLSSIPSTGALVYVPGVSKLYSWYMIGVPGTWHLGSYIPGMVFSCWMGVPPVCAPAPSFGQIFMVGTSKLF